MTGFSSDINKLMFSSLLLSKGGRYMLPSTTSFLYDESLIDTNKPSHTGEVFIEHILVALSLESTYVINPPCELQCFHWAKQLNPSIWNRDKSAVSSSQVSWKQITRNLTFWSWAVSSSARILSNFAFILCVFKLNMFKCPSFFKQNGRSSIR